MIRYSNRVFRPCSDALALARTAQSLADAHIIGRLVLPLNSCIDGLRYNIAETLTLLRRATPTGPEEYRTQLLGDLARFRRQLAECEAARDKVIADHGHGERVTVTCPSCRAPSNAACLHDGRRLVLGHDFQGLICAGVAAILKGGFQ